MKHITLIATISLAVSVIIIVLGWNYANDYFYSDTYTDNTGNSVELQRLDFEDIVRAEPEQEVSIQAVEEAGEEALIVDINTQSASTGSVCRSLSIPICDRYTESAIITAVSEEGCVQRVSCVPLIESTKKCDYSGPEFKTQACTGGQVGVSVVDSDGCFLPNFCVVGSYVK